MKQAVLSRTVMLVSLGGACSSPNAASPKFDLHGGAGGAVHGMSGASSASGGDATAMPSGGSSPAGSGGASGEGSGTGGAALGGSGGTGGSMIVPVGETPEAQWVNVTNNLAGMASECGNLGRVSPHPYKDLLLVGVAQKGLFGSGDGGASWHPLGATGDTITNRISYVAYDPADPDVFWESGIYNGGGVYKTSDGGTTFSRLGDVTHCDSISVDFSDAARNTLLAGSHEQARKLFRSTDGGQSWQDIGSKLPQDSGFCTVSLILDAKTFVVGCGGWYGGTPGIHRSVDGGESFTPVSDRGVAGQPLVASDGTIYWAGHQAGGLYRSIDRGETFTAIAEPDETRSVEPIELPDGRIVTVAAMTLVVSSDNGDTWQPLADTLPFTPNGVSYSPYRNAFYIWQWDCENAVRPDAIARFGYDYRE